MAEAAAELVRAELHEEQNHIDDLQLQLLQVTLCCALHNGIARICNTP